MKKFSRHVEFEKLVKQVEGGLAPNELRSVEKHLSDCKACAGQMRRLENFFQLAAKNDTEKVSQSVTANLLNIYKKPNKQAKKTNPLKRLVALLIFDDWQPEFAVQERLSFPEMRQFIYRAGRYQIDLRLKFNEGKCQVSGQIFPDCPGGKIILHSYTIAAQSDLNENSEFVLPEIPEGIYRLEIESSEETIEFESINLIL